MKKLIIVAGYSEYLQKTIFDLQLRTGRLARNYDPNCEKIYTVKKAFLKSVNVKL